MLAEDVHAGHLSQHTLEETPKGKDSNYTAIIILLVRV
jgi:hypothetical protein